MDVALATVPQAQEDAARKAKALYNSACATCHGVNGTGAPKQDTALEIPLPDFTDCSFATREPDTDWYAVTHDGGPARAFDRSMPAFGDALNDEEIQEILNHVRSLCRSKAWPRGELNLPRALVTEKAYPEDEAVLTTSIAAEGPGEVSNEIVYERRFGAQNQFEIVVPFDAMKSGDNWSGGIGDIKVGVKRSLFHSLDSGTIFSVIGEVVLPTGNEDRGFGKGVTIVEPAVTFGQILPSDSFLQFHGGLEISTDSERADHEAFGRIAIGKSFTQGRFGRAWSPMVELLASHEFGGKVDWDLLPEMQVTLSTRQHIMLNAGVRFPLSDPETRSTRIIVYFLWDWFDGGLFDGW